ncbi:hypothetical protein EVAR_24885_1 [Eumeta japonica]|uniref:Uncharacterized protein n=1 Tax=Eumeta variegata TaxID=151549 RepID=A0A4C1V5A7_EUMVA|nr:hypothetical protein EVAR_24885_1 [Eumeta japonica]
MESQTVSPMGHRACILSNTSSSAREHVCRRRFAGLKINTAARQCDGYWQRHSRQLESIQGEILSVRRNSRPRRRVLSKARGPAENRLVSRGRFAFAHFPSATVLMRIIPDWPALYFILSDRAFAHRSPVCGPVALRERQMRHRFPHSVRPLPKSLLYVIGK